MGKIYDLAVVAGTYTDRSGAEKKRWKNVGSVLETKDGGKLILLDRTFNPAGVPVEDGRDSIMISMFKPKEEGGNGQHTDQKSSNSASSYSQGARNSSVAGMVADMADDIPF